MLITAVKVSARHGLCCGHGSRLATGDGHLPNGDCLTGLLVRASIIGGNQSAESDVEGEKSMREKDVGV